MMGTVAARNVGAEEELLLVDPASGQPRAVAGAVMRPQRSQLWGVSIGGLPVAAVRPGRVWKAFRLKPHLADGFKVSTDPLFTGKVHDVAGLYLSPPGHAVVLCAGEKSQIQALDRSSPVLPMMPGMPGKRTRDYVRYAAATLSAAPGIATGLVISSLHRQHRAAEREKFLQRTGREVPAGLEVHIVAGQLRHAQDPGDPAVACQPSASPHALHAGQLVVAEPGGTVVWRADRQDDRRGAHKSVQALEADIRAWTGNWNEDPRPFVWTKTADEILESLGRLLLRTSGAGH